MIFNRVWFINNSRTLAGRGVQFDRPNCQCPAFASHGIPCYTLEAIGNVFEAQRNDPRLLTTEIAKETCDSKAELIAALRDGNSERARQLMSQQIQRGRKVVVEYFNRQRRKRC